MPTLKPYTSRVVSPQLQVARYYARPVLPVFYQGLNGFGQANFLSNQQLERTLRQWALSPFSVNSQEYMRAIREEYGYEDNGLYNALGTVGGVVGAGMGAILSSGVAKNLLTRPTYQLPYNSLNRITQPSVLSRFQLNPKRTARDKIFRYSAKDIKAINDPANKVVIDNYNNALDSFNKLSKTEKV